jgi:uncharacterized protein (TIRG00374 family)
MKVFRWVGVLIGLSIAGYLMHEVGLGAIRHTLGLLGWGYTVVLAYPITWILLNTAGWRSALPRAYGALSLTYLASIRVAGETFNSLLPSGYVGGEPLKAKLLSREMPMREAASSVLIAKAAQSVGLVFFVGIGLSLGHLGHQSPLKDPRTLTALCLLAAGIGIFTFLLANRSFSRMGQALHRLTGMPWLQKQDETLLALDESIGAFYREGKSRFLISVLWHVGGWLAGALEVGLIFWMLGSPVSWTQAWFIGAMAQLASVIGLFVPAGVGLYEGGHYMAASLLGINPELGLSVSLIRRVREVFWDLIGIGLFWRLGREEVSKPEGR